MTSAPHNSDPSLAQLVNELMRDAQHLMRQELELAKHEIRQEVRKAIVAMVSLGIGIGLASLGGLLLIVMLVHVLHEYTELSLWMCYGIIGGICAIVGAVLLYTARNKIASIDVVPQQTVETMKENVRWIKEKALSGRT